MPALTAIFSADASQFNRELDKMSGIAARTAKQISGNFQRTQIQPGGIGGIGGGWTQIVHSLRATADSLASGAPPLRIFAQQIPKVAQGLLSLGSRIPFLKLLVGETKSAANGANILAAAWGAQARTAGIASISAIVKSQASLRALYAEGGESVATLEAAVSDEAKAAAAIKNAEATRVKAVASAQAAQAAQAEAAATTTAIGPLGVVAGIIVAVGAGALASWKLVGNLVDRLSGLKPAEFDASPIAKHLQSVNQAAEAQRHVNDEITKSVELYHSAASAAERLSKATSDHFDHLKKMNGIAKDIALANAKTPEEKLSVEKTFSENDLKIGADERRQNLANKYAEQFNLKSEGNAKLREAESIRVPSRDHDENIARQRNQAAAEAQKYLDESSAAKGGVKEKVVRGYNAVALSGVSGDDLDAAQAANRAEALRRIQSAKGFQETMHSNDLLRGRKEELVKSGGASLSKAAVVGEQIQTTTKTNAQAASVASAEAAGHLALEAAKEKPKLFDKPSAFPSNFDKPSGFHSIGQPTPNQRIGAFIGGPEVKLLSVNQQQLAVLQQIRNALNQTRQHKAPSKPVGHVEY